MAISVLGGGGPGNAEGDLDEETGDGGDQGQGGDGGDQGQGGDGDDQGQGDGSDSTSGGSGGSGLSSEEPKKAADFSLGSTEPSIQGDDKSVYDKLGITGLALPEGATGRENPETATPQGEEGENMPEK